MVRDPLAAPLQVPRPAAGHSEAAPAKESRAASLPVCSVVSKPIDVTASPLSAPPSLRGSLLATDAAEQHSAPLLAGLTENCGQVNQVRVIVHDQEWEVDSSDHSTLDGTFSRSRRWGHLGVAPVPLHVSAQALQVNGPGASASAAAGAASASVAAASSHAPTRHAAASAADLEAGEEADQLHMVIEPAQRAMVPFSIEMGRESDRRVSSSAFGGRPGGRLSRAARGQRRTSFRSPRSNSPADFQPVAPLAEVRESPVARASSVSSSPHGGSLPGAGHRCCGRFTHFVLFSALHVVDFALRTTSICIMAVRLPVVLGLLVPVQVLGTLMSAYITFHDADVSLWMHRASARFPAFSWLTKALACVIFFVVFGCLQLIQVKRTWARQLHAADLLVDMDIEDQRAATASSVPAYAFACGERILPVDVLTGVPYLFVITYVFMCFDEIWTSNGTELAILFLTSMVVLATVSFGIREIDFAVSSYVVKCAHARFVRGERLWTQYRTWLFTPCHVLFRGAEVSLRVLVVGIFFICTHGLFGEWRLLGRFVSFGIFFVFDYGFCVALLWWHSPKKERMLSHFFVAIMLLVSDLAHFVDQPSFTAPARKLSRRLFLWRLLGCVFVGACSLAQRHNYLQGKGAFSEGWNFQARTLAMTAVLYYMTASAQCIRSRGEDLHTAAGKGNHDRIRKLLQPNESAQVLDVNARTKDSLELTPAMLAAERGYTRVLESLHESGAELNLKSAQGDTCLHFAVRASQLAVCRFLMRQGVDAHIANNAGKFPWDITPTRGFANQQANQICELYSNMKESRKAQTSRSSLCRGYIVPAQAISGERLRELFRDAAEDDTPSPHALHSVSGLIVARAAGVLAMRILARQDEEAGTGIIPLGTLQRVDELGRGGFARVIKVELPSAHRGSRQFALKLQKKRKGRQVAASEASALRLARHPFIVRLEQAFQTPLFFAFLLELCPSDLNRLLCETTTGTEEDAPSLGLPAERAARYMGQVLLALTYLHDCSKTYVHRDVKPENVLISPKDEAKLADFGLARDLETSHPADVAGPSGTMGFMAPELLANGWSRETETTTLLKESTKQDAYAFGVTLQLTLLGQDAGRRIEVRGKKVMLPLSHTEDEMADLLRNLVASGRLSQEAKNLLADKLLPWDPVKRARLSDREVMSHAFFLNTLDCSDLKEHLMPTGLGGQTPGGRRHRFSTTPRSLSRQGDSMHSTRSRSSLQSFFSP